MIVVYSTSRGRGLFRRRNMVKVGRWIYVIMSWLFVAGVVVQVFLAGMAVVALRGTWNNHISIGHSLAGPLLLMLISQYMGKLPGRVKWTTWGLFLVYALQADVVIFMRASFPAVSALHPVLALVDFALGWTLATQAVQLLSKQPQTAAVVSAAAD